MFRFDYFTPLRCLNNILQLKTISTSSNADCLHLLSWSLYVLECTHVSFKPFVCYMLHGIRLNLCMDFVDAKPLVSNWSRSIHMRCQHIVQHKQSLFPRLLTSFPHAKYLPMCGPATHTQESFYTTWKPYEKILRDQFLCPTTYDVANRFAQTK
jgi:hypothetical protein